MTEKGFDKEKLVGTLANYTASVEAGLKLPLLHGVIDGSGRSFQPLRASFWNLGEGLKQRVSLIEN